MIKKEKTMTLRQRGYLTEGAGKKIDTGVPNHDDHENYDRNELRNWRKTVPAGLANKILKWKSDFGHKLGDEDFVSRHAVVRFLSHNGTKIDFMIQLYDLDPDGEGKDKLRLNWYIRGPGYKIVTIGHFGSVLAATKAAKLFIKKQIEIRAPKSIQRLTLS